MTYLQTGCVMHIQDGRHRHFEKHEFANNSVIYYPTSTKFYTKMQNKRPNIVYKIPDVEIRFKMAAIAFFKNHQNINISRTT
jgi:hypothetical protein